MKRIILFLLVSLSGFTGFPQNFLSIVHSFHLAGKNILWTAVPVSDTEYAGIVSVPGTDSAQLIIFSEEGIIKANSSFLYTFSGSPKLLFDSVSHTILIFGVNPANPKNLLTRWRFALSMNLLSEVSLVDNRSSPEDGVDVFSAYNDKTDNEYLTYSVIFADAIGNFVTNYCSRLDPSGKILYSFYLPRECGTQVLKVTDTVVLFDQCDKDYDLQKLDTQLHLFAVDSLQPRSYTNQILTGEDNFNVFTEADSAVYLHTYDFSGEEINDVKLPFNTNHQNVKRAAILPEGNFLFVIQNFINQDSSLVFKDTLCKTSTEGIVLWKYGIADSLSDVTQYLFVNSANNFVLIGQPPDSSRVYILTIGDVTGITPVQENNLLKVFPDPAKNTMHLTFNSKAIAQFQLCDLAGKEIYACNLYPSMKNYTLHLGQLSSGIYLWHLKENGEMTQAGKICIMQ